MSNNAFGFQSGGSGGGPSPGGCEIVVLGTSCCSTLRCGVINTASGAYSFIVGSNITSDRVCATFVNNLSIKNIPTSSAGLPTKSVWFDSATCTLKIVP